MSIHAATGNVNSNMRVSYKADTNALFKHQETRDTPTSVPCCATSPISASTGLTSKPGRLDVDRREHGVTPVRISHSTSLSSHHELSPTQTKSSRHVHLRYTALLTLLLGA